MVRDHSAVRARPQRCAGSKIFFLGTLLPIGILLPVLGILTVTSEWSQRTALTTFALVPARSRVVGAKLAAGMIIALASLGASGLIAAAVNLVAMAIGGDAAWGIGLAQVGAAAVMQLINVFPQESWISSGRSAPPATSSMSIVCEGARRLSVGEPGFGIDTSPARETCGSCVCP